MKSVFRAASTTFAGDGTLGISFRQCLSALRSLELSALSFALSSYDGQGANLRLNSGQAVPDRLITATEMR